MYHHFAQFGISRELCVFSNLYSLRITYTLIHVWAHNNKKERRRLCLQFCWGNQWRYSCIVCLQSGSTPHICRRTHRVVYRRCWWEPRTPCPRRHTLLWACTESSSTPTLYLHTHRRSDHQRHETHLFLSAAVHMDGNAQTHTCTINSHTNLFQLTYNTVYIYIFQCRQVSVVKMHALCTQCYQW